MCKRKTGLSAFALEMMENGTSHQINLKTEISMIDAKMRGLITGLGGAYCLLCTVEKGVACGRSADLGIIFPSSVRTFSTSTALQRPPERSREGSQMSMAF